MMPLLLNNYARNFRHREGHKRRYTAYTHSHSYICNIYIYCLFMHANFFPVGKIKTGR